MTSRPLILITNDDGIDSPGLHASANAVADLGDLLIVAPSTQKTGSGRSYPPIQDKAVYETTIPLAETHHVAYKADVSPAQAVSLAVFDLTPRPISLCISGINYGENVGSGVTISGTVGAALEAASFNIPSLAMSLETPPEYHLSHSREIDFTAAAHFTRIFAQHLLAKGLPQGVDMLKIDIPSAATPETGWRVGRISRQRYYEPIPSGRTHLAEQKVVGYRIGFDENKIEPDSDVYIVAVARQVAVVPMTMDLTAHRALPNLDSFYQPLVSAN